MKPEIYQIEKAFWRPHGAADYEEVRLRRGRLRVMRPDSVAYFYIEDPAQMEAIYKVWEKDQKRIQMQIHLQDLAEPQMIAGVPKPETPPYDNPPFHLKLQFETNELTIPLQQGQ